MAIETEVEWGGAGASFTSAILAIEGKHHIPPAGTQLTRRAELAKVDASVSVLCDVHNTLVNTVLRKYGSDYIKNKYLPELSASKLGSFCLSEAGSGSDAFAMKTTAKLSEDGSYYTLSGSKVRTISHAGGI